MDPCLSATMALYFHNHLVVWIGKQAGLNENSVLYKIILPTNALLIKT
jgi:hypothetical protein